jgi:hypothetical protein
MSREMANVEASQLLSSFSQSSPLSLSQASFIHISSQRMSARMLQHAYRQEGFGLVELELVVSTSPRDETVATNSSLAPASVR